MREGCLADILLIDGDPLADITVLQDKARILAVMKDGEFHRAPPVRARAHDALGRLTEGDAMARRPLHQRPHPRRHAARARTPAACWCRATASARSARSSAALAPAGATVIDGAGATLMPGMCEAHTHFSWNDAATLAGIQTHAARGARAVVRQGRQALPRGRLDLVRRRRLRQAAPRRRHPQRDQLGPDPRPALPRREPGDHGARRPRRRDPAAPAVPRVQLRRQRQLAPTRCARPCACS